MTSMARGVFFGSVLSSEIQRLRVIIARALLCFVNLNRQRQRAGVQGIDREDLLGDGKNLFRWRSLRLQRLRLAQAGDGRLRIRRDAGLGSRDRIVVLRWAIGCRESALPFGLELFARLTNRLHDLRRHLADAAFGRWQGLRHLVVAAEHHRRFDANGLVGLRDDDTLEILVGTNLRREHLRIGTRERLVLRIAGVDEEVLDVVLRDGPDFLERNVFLHPIANRVRDLVAQRLRAAQDRNDEALGIGRRNDAALLCAKRRRSAVNDHSRGEAERGHRQTRLYVHCAGLRGQVSFTSDARRPGGGNGRLTNWKSRPREQPRGCYFVLQYCFTMLSAVGAYCAI
jgi:hypothetical protein